MPVAMDQDDVDSIDKLMAIVIKFDVRKVPADSPEHIEDLLKNGIRKNG